MEESDERPGSTIGRNFAQTWPGLFLATMLAVAGCQAPAAPFDPAFPSDVLPVQAFGHGKLWLMLHGHAGYLDDLELVIGRRFPEPETIKVRVDKT